MKVSILIPQEGREWGYNPCPNGTIAEVLGPDKIHYGRTNGCGREPGVYENWSWIRLKMPDGKENCINASYLKTLDGKDFPRKESQRLGDLPETKFWEGDWVRGANENAKIVSGINWEWMGDKRDDGSPMPIYRVSNKLEGGWYINLGDDDLKLVERGNIWKYFNSQPSFGFEEEAQFYAILGMTTQVKAPNGSYAWTMKEAIEGLKNGSIHGFPGLFPPKNCSDLCCIRYKNEAFGKRVAAFTLTWVT